MGQGLFQLCAKLGKFPHEFEACNDEEFEYLKAAWNEENKKAGK